MKRTLISLSCIFSLTAGTALAQVLPLKELSWDSPVFKERVLGTFAPKAEIEPAINQDEKELFEKLIPLVQQEQVDQAVQILSDYMAGKPDASAALDFTLGNLYFQQNKLDPAEAAYVKAIKKFPNFSRSYENLGRIHVMRGDYKNARSYLVQAIELGGPQSDLYGLLGFCYLNMEMPSSALVAYDAASLLDPENKDWQLGRAQSLVQSDRNLEAIPLLKELVNEDIANRNLVLSISNAYLDLGEYLKSAAYLELLNRTGNANSSSLLLLGDIYMNEKLPSLALPVYRKAMESSKDRLSLSTALRVAKVYTERGFTDAARQVIADIERLYASSITDQSRLDLLNVKSKLALLEDQTGEAAKLLEEVIKVDPLNGEALLTLASLHWQLGDLESAEFYFERAQTVDAVKFRAFLDHARLLVSQSNYKDAAKLLQRAYELNPAENVRDYLEAVQQIASR